MKSQNELKHIGIKLLICFGFVTFISCNVIKNQPFNSSGDLQRVILGSIGSTPDLSFQNNFKMTGLATFKSPIRVSVTPVSFSKSSYKVFLKAKKYQMVNVNPVLNDSLKSHPKFVNIQIADRLSLIDQLNGSYNKIVKDYLSRQAKAKLITSVSLALSQSDINKIAQADIVFLTQNKLKEYVLQLHNSDEAVYTLKFNQGVVFDYKSSSSCWQENENHQLSIVDLVDGAKACPPKTYKYAPRAIKEINYIKF